MRIVVSVLFVFLLTAVSAVPTGAADWAGFKARFLAEDGRVVDHRQDKISHSEGQGYGLILAVANKDKEAFYKILAWTRNNLDRRGTDNLLAWSFGERLPGRWEPVDLNNASDGDILVAAGLLLGAEVFADAALQTEALGMVRDIRERLVVEYNGRLHLLPAYYGYQKEEGVILNPSYFILPAFELFARHDEPEFWKRLIRDSAAIMQDSQQTRLGLTSDWILSDKDGVKPYKPERFGYDAIRVLLYAAWEGNYGRIPKTAEILDTAFGLGYVPEAYDTDQGEVSLTAGPGGFYAVYARAAADAGRKDAAKKWWKEAEERVEAAEDDYYSYVLFLLAKLTSISPDRKAQ